MIMKNEKLIAGTFNNYFADITKTLKLNKHPNFDGQSLFIITDYFKSNEIAIKIKKKYGTHKNSFSFTLFLKEDILQAIKSLSSNKASPIEEFLLRFWKIQFISTQKNLLIFSMNAWLTECLINGEDVTLIFKKENDNEKKNYCPVSMLSTFSKLFEKLLFEQVNDHMQIKLSKHLTGFCKNHST